jgi:hypothetical protein
MGATSAAKTQAGAENAASQLENQQFQQTQANLAPFREAGTAALPTLQGLLGTGGQAPNPTAFTSSPGYQFMMNQGQQQVQNAASATGGVNSGKTLKELTNYGQGLASNTYQQYLGNIQNMVGMGQNAAAQTGAFGAANANQVGANTIAAGQDIGAGKVAGSNAINNAIGGVSQNALLYQLLQQQQGGGGFNFFGGGGGGGGGSTNMPLGYGAPGAGPNPLYPGG